jgi:hypothetical protein
LIIANFDVTTQNVATGFPYGDDNLMDNTAINVINTSTPISLAAGEFRIYGNKTASLAMLILKISMMSIYILTLLVVTFQLLLRLSRVLIYNMVGQLVKNLKAILMRIIVIL